MLQDANLLAEVLAFLPHPAMILLTREVTRFWRDTATRPLLRVALHVLGLKRARLQSDAFVSFHTSGLNFSGAENLHPAVKWLVSSFENSICSAVFDELGGSRKFVVDAIVWFLDQGLTRLLIVAQPSALRDWARMLQAAGVPCTDQIRSDHRHGELYTRLHSDPGQRTPAVLLRTPTQVEVELVRAEREGPSAPGIFGARYWHYAVFDAAPMVHLHDSQQVALSNRLKLQQESLSSLPDQHGRTSAPLPYVLLSASSPPTQLHMLAPLLQLCHCSAPSQTHIEEGTPAYELRGFVNIYTYSQMLEVVDRFCMGDADTRRWALKDYLPSEVAYLLRPCLLHVHA